MHTALFLQLHPLSTLIRPENVALRKRSSNRTEPGNFKTPIDLEFSCEGKTFYMN